MGKFKDLLDKQEIIILDGALGTELESRGYDVSGKLGRILHRCWPSRCLS